MSETITLPVPSLALASGPMVGTVGFATVGLDVTQERLHDAFPDGGATRAFFFGGYGTSGAGRSCEMQCGIEKVQQSLQSRL